MWHKAEWMGRPMRLELTRVVDVSFMVIYEALCFVVAQGRMNGAPNETRTHSCSRCIVYSRGHDAEINLRTWLWLDHLIQVNEGL